MNKQLKFTSNYARFASVVLFFIFFSVVWLKHVPSNQSYAANIANLYFKPEQASLPPEKTVGLWIDLGSSSLGYLRIELVFDPNKVNLTDEIQAPDITTTNFNATSKDEANQTGRVVLIHELQANKPSLTGTLEVALMTLEVETTDLDQWTNITIADIKAQLVERSIIELQSTSKPLVLSLNSSNLPAATPTFTTIPNPLAPPLPTFQVPLPTVTFTPPPAAITSTGNKVFLPIVH